MRKRGGFMKKNYLLFLMIFLFGCNIYQTGVGSNSDDSETYSLRSSVKTDGIIYQLKIYDDYLYIADGTNGVLIYDVSNIDYPEYVCTLNTFGTAYSVNKKDGIVYIADDGGGLRVIDSDNFLFPQELSCYPLENAFYLDRDNEKVVVAAGSGGVKLFDVSNNYAPYLLDEKSIAGEIFLCAKFISGNEIVCGTDAGLYLYKIENGTLSLENSVFSQNVFDVIEANNFIYAGSGNELIKYEINDHNLIRKDRLVFFDQIRSISYQNGRLYVATSNSGLNVVDINNPLMNSVDNLQIGSEQNSVLVNENRLYIGDNQGVVRIYHIN